MFRAVAASKKRGANSASSTRAVAPSSKRRTFKAPPVRTPEEVAHEDAVYEKLKPWIAENEPAFTQVLLEQNYIEVFDAHARFDPGPHTYTIDDTDVYGIIYELIHRGSCTGIIHSFFPEFDSVASIRRISSESRWRTDRSYKYYQIAAKHGLQERIAKAHPEGWPATKEAYAQCEWAKKYTTAFAKLIKHEWDTISEDASTKGTALHAYIEAFYNGYVYPHDTPENMGPEFRQFHKFHREVIEAKGLEPFRTELTLFDRTDESAGQIDGLFRKKNRPADGSEDNILYMLDWKRSKEIKMTSFTGTEYGYGPCHDQQVCNYETYSTQLNLYSGKIEKYTKYRIAEMYLAVFHPNQGEDYQCLPVRMLRKKCQLMCELRRHNLMMQDLATLQKLTTDFYAEATREYIRQTPTLVEDNYPEVHSDDSTLPPPEEDPLPISHFEPKEKLVKLADTLHKAWPPLRRLIANNMPDFNLEPMEQAWRAALAMARPTKYGELYRVALRHQAQKMGKKKPEELFRVYMSVQGVIDELRKQWDIVYITTHEILTGVLSVEALKSAPFELDITHLGMPPAKH